MKIISRRLFFFMPKRDQFDLFNTCKNMNNIKLYDKGSSLWLTPNKINTIFKILEDKNLLKGGLVLQASD
uniref:Uncharacterized protein n=1 Tax=Salix viminalis TaxID=40686 RepID=A0A6N2MAU0_SALVM